MKWRVITILLLPLLGVVLLTLVSQTVVEKGSSGYVLANTSDLQQAEVALVLGASVYQNGALTPVLLDRVEKAIELYELGVVKKILISGDNGTQKYNEVSPVRMYLIEKGIKEEDIFVDYAGFDTFDSMYRARDVFEVNSLVVVTQSFHLPRAVYIARSLGLDAYGVSADAREYLAKNSHREILANVKAVIDVTIGSRPIYLGEKIPISGDGRASWTESEIIDSMATTTATSTATTTKKYSLPSS